MVCNGMSVFVEAAPSSFSVGGTTLYDEDITLSYTQALAIGDTDEEIASYLTGYDDTIMTAKVKIYDMGKFNYVSCIEKANNTYYIEIYLVMKDNTANIFKAEHIYNGSVNDSAYAGAVAVSGVNNIFFYCGEYSEYGDNFTIAIPGEENATWTDDGLRIEYTITFSEPSYTITNNTAQANVSTNHGYVAVDGSAKEGDNVTVTATPANGYELDTLTYTPDGGSATTITKDGNGKYTFTMPAVNVTVSATFKQTFSATYSASLTLNEGFDVNIIMQNFGEGFDASKVSATVDGNALASSAISYDKETGKVKIKAASKLPTQLNDNIAIVISYDGTEIKTINYSVFKYCDAVLKSNSYGADSLMGKLCIATLNYGTMAEKCYASKTSGFVSGDYTYANLANAVNEYGGMPAVGDTGFEADDVFTAATASLVLGTKISLQFKITTTKEIEDKDFIVKNQDGGDVNDSDLQISKSGDVYTILINNIEVSQLDRKYTVTVNGEENFQITYGVFDYCAAAQGNSNISQDTQDLCKTLYIYSKAASAYAN